MNCKFCKKELTPDQIKRNCRYCSVKCNQAVRFPPVYAICQYCGLKYRIKPVHKDTNRFCSHKCKGQWVKANRSGVNSPKWKGGNTASFARYNKKNPHKRCELSSKRRALIRQAPYEKVERTEIIERDDAICYICGKHLTPKEIELDHIIPLSKHGPHSATNLAVCCRPCNTRKKARLLEEFLSFLPSYNHPVKDLPGVAFFFGAISNCSSILANASESPP